MASVYEAILAAAEQTANTIKSWASGRFLTEHQNIDHKADKNHNHDGIYLTEHQDISGKADKVELHSHNNKSVLDTITADKINQITTNQNEISQLKQDITQKVDANHTHTDYVSKTGHTANKYLGTDDSGNVVEKEAPASGNTVVENPYSLPIASDTILGGIKAGAKTDADTVPVHIDADGRLWVAQGGTLDIAQIASQLGVQANVDEAGDLTLTIIAKGGAV